MTLYSSKQPNLVHPISVELKYNLQLIKKNTDLSSKSTIIIMKSE